MKIEPFEMERMQSTWENLVELDMSESGVRPLTLRELVAMGFDLEEFLDQPLGYSQSNGTIELRERIAAIYPGARVDQIEVTNGTSEANYLVALSQLGPGDGFAMELPNYMQMPGVARSLATLGAQPAAVGGATTRNGAFRGTLAALLRGVASVDALVRDFRNSSRMPGVDRIFVPGEHSHQTRARRTRDGIPIPPALMRGLNQVAEELGIAKLA